MNRTLWTGYRCVACGGEQPTDYAGWVCPSCGMDGILDVVYDYEALRGMAHPTSFDSARRPTLWTWEPFLPVRTCKLAVRMGIGGTPLLRARGLEKALGVGGEREIWIKDDTRTPSSCAKDRATAVCLSRAAELGKDVVACASTGNAASSLALLGAAAADRVILFVPEAAPAPKVAQLLASGATVIRVRGTYDDAYALSLAAIERFGWYSRNSGHNSLLAEGKKTAALEIGKDLLWKAPAAVFVPVGDGSVLAGAWKGFWELRRTGLVAGAPRMFGVQAEGASPILASWRRLVDAGAATPGEPLEDDAGGESAFASPALAAATLAVAPAKTRADSISVGKPNDWRRGLASVTRSGGRWVGVADEEILDAVRLLARTEGLFVEPAAGAAIAGLRRALADGAEIPEGPLVALVTGSGLKDPTAATASLPSPEPIAPDVEEVARIVGER